MKALILSCSTGGGHNAAGRAMQQALERRGHEVVMLDPYELKSRELAKTVGDVYVKTVQHVPKVFGGAYRLGNLVRKAPGRSPVYLINIRMAARLQCYLTEGCFDAVIMPHLFPAEIITSLKRKGKKLPLCVFLATDYTCIPFTEETECDYYVIPAEDLTEEFTGWGIPKEKILPMGIPVGEEFSKKTDREEVKAGLGLEADKRYLVISGGSMGAGDLSGLVDQLTDCMKKRPQWRIIVICGNNEGLYRKLESAYGDSGQVSLLGYTKQMAAYMKSCDIFVTKPGGLTTTEAAAVGVPLIHISPIPGCEDRNLEYFCSRGMSEALRKTEDTERVFERLSDPKNRQAMICSQKERINPNAAEDICRFLEKIISDANQAPMDLCWC